MACFTLTLKGAKPALIFLFKPDFSKLTGEVFMNALGLAFFKLSVGELTMANYFSSFPKNSKPISTVFKLLFIDLFISILCGLVIFPVVFTYSNEVPRGTGLLFVTSVVLFKKFAYGNILLVLFMLLAVIAGIGSLISLTYVVYRAISTALKANKKIAALVSFILISILSVLVSLSTTPVLDSITIKNKNLFDVSDYISSNITLPLGGILIILLIIFKVKKENFESFLISCGSNTKMIKLLSFIMTYITPLVILFVWIKSLGVI